MILFSNDNIDWVPSERLRGDLGLRSHSNKLGSVQVKKVEGSMGRIEAQPNRVKRRYRIRSWQLSVITAAIVIVLVTSYVLLIYVPRSNLNLVYASSDEKACSVDKALISANNKFAFNLWRELVVEEGTTNIFVSPLSVSIALTMTYNGAEGTTRDAMTKVLEFGAMSLETVNQEYSNLMESLETADKQVSILIGNSIWMKKDFEPIVNSNFLEKINAAYDSEIFKRDFGNPQTVTEINGWIDESTEGKITEVIQTIEPELVMFLVNAIYFKGEWVTQFDEAKTEKADFFLPDGNTVEVDMMSTAGNFSYYSGESFQAVRLPYGRDKLAMYLFLPHENVSLDSVIADLSQTTHEEYINRFKYVGDHVINLPKFTVEYGVKRLNRVLEKLGMEIAFSPTAANFSGIASTAPENLYISYVDHKAVVEVNEKGTEASAATIVGIGLTSLPPSFTVNRPFFFTISDDRSGSILFMGQIVNPTYD